MGKPNFSEDFKRDAVHQITVRGYAVREVSERLGVSTYSLYKWMKLCAKAASQTSSVDHEAENRRLKRELARLAGIRAEIGYKRKLGKYGGRP
jgi:transposase